MLRKCLSFIWALASLAGLVRIEETEGTDWLDVGEGGRCFSLQAATACDLILYRLILRDALLKKKL